MRANLLMLSIMLSATTAGSQTAATRYESAYVKAGVLLRASAVCGGNAKSLIKRAFAQVSSPEYQKISRAFPQTIERWMRSGAGAFNDAVMSEGVEAACRKATR